MRAARLAVVVAALALASPAVASAASTYCVHQGGSCPAGQVDKGANLQSALTAASGSSGNTVLIGPGTFTQSSDFQYSSTTDPVTITGAGVGATILSTTAPATDVLDFTAPAPSQLSELTIEATANLSGGFALLLDGPSASSTTGPVVTNIAVTLPTPGTVSGTGASVADGATLTDSAIDDQVATAGTSRLSDDSITSSGDGLIIDGTLTASRLKINAQTVGIEAQIDADGTVDGLLMRGIGGAGDSTAAWAQNGGQLTIRSATFAGGTPPWREALASNGTGGSSSLTILDSIFSSFTQGPECTATSGTSSITFGNDDRHVFGPETCSGGGTFTPGTGNIDADPRFVAPASGDYHLLWNSPAIDAGQTSCGAPCQSSDLDGLIRPIDGNGDGVAVRDMGAYEYGRRAPAVQASASPSSATTVTPVRFSAAATDPDDGDVLSIAWSFDDGTTATGPVVNHTFSTPGTHTATVTVHDPTGLAASAATAVRIAVAPPSRDTRAPTVSSLRVSPSTFAVARGRTATIATAKPKGNAKPKGKRHRQGTKITFKLSEQAKIVIEFTRRTRGIKVGRSCQAPSHKHRHGRACTRYVGAGSLTRRSERPGSVSIAFTGRLGRKALATGGYRLGLVATDPSRNSSRSQTKTFTIVSR